MYIKIKMKNFFKIALTTVKQTKNLQTKYQLSGQFSAKKIKKIIEDIGYYRFKYYLKQTGITSFDDAYALYLFNIELSNILLHAISKIEISFKTNLFNELGTFFNQPNKNKITNNPFIYTQQNIYDSSFIKKGGLDTIFKEIKICDEEFIEHFSKKYALAYPPIWTISGVLTFGTSIWIYEGLSNKLEHIKGNNFKMLLAKRYNAKGKNELISWLKHLKNIRNKAAHFQKIWDSDFKSPLSEPFMYSDTSIELKYLQQTRKKNGTYKKTSYHIIESLFLINHCLKARDLDNKFLEKILDLRSKYKHLSILEQYDEIEDYLTRP